MFSEEIGEIAFGVMAANSKHYTEDKILHYKNKKFVMLNKTLQLKEVFMESKKRDYDGLEDQSEEVINCKNELLAVINELNNNVLRVQSCTISKKQYKLHNELKDIDVDKEDTLYITDNSDTFDKVFRNSKKRFNNKKKNSGFIEVLNKVNLEIETNKNNR